MRAPQDEHPITTSDLLAKAIAQAQVTGEEGYLAFVRERTSHEPLLEVPRDDDDQL